MTCNRKIFIFNSITTVIVFMLVMFLSDNLNCRYFILTIEFFALNFFAGTWTFQTFMALPTLIIRSTGLARYVFMLFALSSNSFAITDDKIIALMAIEMIVEYLTILLVDRRFKKAKVDNIQEAKNDVEPESKNGILGISSIIVLIVGVVVVFKYSNIIGNYIILSASKVSIGYSSGAISLICSAFFLLLYILLLRYIYSIRVKINFFKFLLSILISVFYINGSSITSENISRWTLLITTFVAFYFLEYYYPEYRKAMMIVVVIAFVWVITVGSMLKFGERYTSYGTVTDTLKSLFQFETLNAYFSGPKNILYALKMKQEYSGSTINSIFSDIFANFPLLNKYLSSDTARTNVLFNYQIYHSDVAIDQIIPMVGQMYFYFGIFFFIPEALITYLSYKLYYKISTSESFLHKYCYTYMSISFSLINCLNFTIMLQNLWINVLPIIIIIVFNIRLKCQGTL